jgi:hypothetical protein
MKAKFKTGQQITENIKKILPSNQQSRDGGTSSADPRHPGTFYKIKISSHYRDCITIFLLTCEIMKY